MKKLQYLVSLLLLLGLGDVSHIYTTSVTSVVFIVSAFVFAEEIENKRSVFFYFLIALMVVFNPFYSLWLEIEQVRVLIYLVTSVFFLLKTSHYDIVLNQPDKDLKSAY